MKVLLVGCGHMGGAMLQGWLGQVGITHIDVVEPGRPGHADKRVTMHKDATTIGRVYDMAVLAVKPQVMTTVCADLAPRLDGGVPVLSIAAGITLATLSKYFGLTRGLIRAMPNTPGAIGQGITGFVHNQKLDSKQVDAVTRLLSVLGEVMALPAEEMMDAVTAVSGSGPAYIFVLTEALQKAAVNNGLPDDVAAKLARQTVIGAAALLAKESTKTPGELRVAVTSPGGTTAAALDVMGKNRALETLLEDAVKAAIQRSKDLAQTG